MNDQTEKTPTAPRKMFRPSKLAWIILILWIALNVFAAVKIAMAAEGPMTGYFLGVLFGSCLMPAIIAWIVAAIVWLIFKRSARAGSITFTVILVLLILSSIVQGLQRVNSASQVPVTTTQPAQ